MNLPKDIMEEFKEVIKGYNNRVFTQEQDNIILELWPVSTKSGFIKIFRKKFGFGYAEIIRGRYRELKKAQK